MAVVTAIETTALPLEAFTLKQQPLGHQLTDPSSHGPAQAPNSTAIETNHLDLTNARLFVVIATLTSITFVGSMSTGLLTVGLPRIAKDTNLAENLLLWPASVYPLTSGCCLLLAGSIADRVGNKLINLAGCFILGVFMLAMGLSQTGIQVILFRAIQGIAVSLCLPTAVGILTHAAPSGKQRNIGFACLGLGQPFGFSVGLVLGGVFAESRLGWRFGFYLSGGATILLCGINFWNLPKDRPGKPVTWKDLKNDIDWVGVALSSGCLGALSYVFAQITGSLSSIKQGKNIAALGIAMALVPAFAFWMNRQEKAGKPALIPNSIWKNTAFTTICFMVMMSWAVLSSIEWFLSLFFQEVQHLSALQSSIRFLPNVIIGIILNFSTGLFIDKVKANRLVVITSIISAGSPLLMAVINPEWSWWWCAFWAVLLSPLSADVIFTVANLIISDVFPAEMQSLAGAIFNTIAQFGNSLGIAIMAVISSSVTANSPVSPKTSPDALMLGYRAVFWACFAMMILASVVGTFGLRKIGRVGLKRE